MRACEARPFSKFQGGALRIQGGANAPPCPPLNETLIVLFCMCVCVCVCVGVCVCVQVYVSNSNLADVNCIHFVKCLLTAEGVFLRLCVSVIRRNEILILVCVSNVRL